jgi:hypothetical protein
VADEDITKGKKKKRRRSARVYINANRPLAVPLDEIAGYFPPDDDEENAMRPDQVKTTGNPVPSPGGRSLTEARVSPPLTAGHQAPSTGDHGAAFADPMAPAGPKRLALGHEDMRSGTTRPVPLLSFRSNADSFPADLRGMSSGVPVALSRLDAASAAGMPGFRADPSGNPAVRPLDRIAQNSATAANGGHGLADVVSRGAPQAMKASDAREMLRRHMFGGNGAR